ATIYANSELLSIYQGSWWTKEYNASDFAGYPDHTYYVEPHHYGYLGADLVSVLDVNITNELFKFVSDVNLTLNVNRGTILDYQEISKGNWTITYHAPAIEGPKNVTFTLKMYKYGYGFAQKNINATVIDMTPPVSRMYGPAGFFHNGTRHFNASAYDALSNVTKVQLWYDYSSNNATWSGWIMWDEIFVEPYRWNFTWPMNSGYYRVSSSGIDTHGNVEIIDEVDWLGFVDLNAPVADAGLDQQHHRKSQVFFNGLNSWDDTNIINYTWEFVYNGSIVYLYGPTPSFTFYVADWYTVNLTVWDILGHSDTDSMLLHVIPISDIRVEPDYMETSLDCGDTQLLLLNIHNDDLGPLNFQIGDLGAIGWLDCVPDSGIVNGTSSIQIFVSVNTLTLDLGEYWADIFIFHNDPWKGDIIVPVNLTVHPAARDLKMLSIDIPQGEAGEWANFSATVKNQGRQDETDVLVELLINGTVVDTTTIPHIAVGEEISVYLHHYTTVAGEYQAEARAVAVPFENNTYNNNASGIFSVIAFPDLWYEPDSFSFVIPVNATASDILTIGNAGYAELDFELKQGKESLDILLAASDTNIQTVQTYLQATGGDKFHNIDIYDTRYGTPTVEQLLAYDAVLVWTNFGPQNAVLLGDNLADYMDQGGGVVMMTFGNTVSWGVSGRYFSDMYGATPRSDNVYNYSNLGTVFIPNHPIMTGINGVSCNFNSGTTEIVPGAVRVANDNLGNTLVATNEPAGITGKAVTLGYFPIAGYGQSGEWQELIANAL
ncbi:MAG TPA: hypothetical protein ENN76_02170, partial [Euryarchaeota archaeon]|nr:hypothetical protein [Euryarchaeota archaeon]